MKNLSPEDQILLREGNIQLKILLAVVIASLLALNLAYELYLEHQSTKNLTEIKNPEAATSGQIHNN